MTKSYFIELAEYNTWANNIACGWFKKISDTQWAQHVTSSFNSIEATVLHIAGAEQVWLERMNKKEDIIWLPSVFKGLKNEHIALWNKTSEGLKSFVANFNESNLHVNLAFKRLNGDAYSMPYYQVLAHVFNHSTYHRGQLVTLLRQVGFTDVQATDLLGFYKK